MENYLNPQDAIDDMHHKGYTNDFELIGNDLLWVQGKKFVRAGDFSILEFHCFPNETGNDADTILFGIIAHGYDTKGILMNHYTRYTSKTPPVINKKLAEMYACAADQLTLLLDVVS